MLLRVDGDMAQTLSLAGTKPAIDLNWSAKEIEEQQIVTDYIEQSLRKLEIHNYRKEKVRNKQAGDIVHLATRFGFNSEYLKGRIHNFISEMHPTPAVCGLPKEKALDLIFQTENHNREYYAGYCGLVSNKDNTDLFVNLRCMKIFPNHLVLYVGGGLTLASIPEKEWEETVLKANTLLSVI
jgi:isochorismate synthase